MAEIWPILQMWHDNNGWGWWMVFGGLWMLIFWGGIIFLIVWGISRITGPRGTEGRPDNALTIARERYARGEISREDYEQIRRDLGG